MCSRSSGDDCCLTALVRRPVDRDADRALDVRLPLPQRLDVDAERLRDFGVFRLATELRRERGARGGLMSRVLRRTDRGTWSWRRSSSRIAPRMRGTANVLNASPRSGSNAFIAAMRPSVPALTSSS